MRRSESEKNKFLIDQVNIEKDTQDTFIARSGWIQCKEKRPPEHSADGFFFRDLETARKNEFSPDIQYLKLLYLRVKSVGTDTQSPWYVKPAQLSRMSETLTNLDSRFKKELEIDLEKKIPDKKWDTLQKRKTEIKTRVKKLGLADSEWKAIEKEIDMAQDDIDLLFFLEKNKNKFDTKTIKDQLLQNTPLTGDALTDTFILIENKFHKKEDVETSIKPSTEGIDLDQPRIIPPSDTPPEYYEKSKVSMFKSQNKVPNYGTFNDEDASQKPTKK